jgi:hypothetical protein
VDLRFRKSGDPAIEKNYRKKLSSPAQPVVFEIPRGHARESNGRRRRA